MIKSIQENRLNRPSFKGGLDIATQALTALSTYPAIGASVVDFCSMSFPRTLIDSQRGFDAGLETGIRENSTTLNTVMIGVVGAGVAALLSSVFNSNYKISAHHIFANGETIDSLGKTWHSIIHDKKGIKPEQRLKAYYDNVLDNLSGLNPQFRKSDKVADEWVKLDKATKEKISEILCTLSSKKDVKYKIPSKEAAYLKNLIVSATGAETDFKLGNVGLSLSSLLDNTFGLGKAFSTERITNIFQKTTDFAKNDFLKELKSLKMRSSLAALAVSGCIGLAIQPLNRYFTKKRTGNDGFVGVKNKKADKSPGFFAAKVAAAATMFSIAMCSIAKFDWLSIPNKVQFKGKFPTIPQYKLLYGITIVSRFLAARDKNELRESFTRDILGFASWLLLGGLAEKAVATAFAKHSKEELLKTDSSKGKGFMTWLLRTSVKSRDEIIQSDLAKRGIKTVTKDGKALVMKEMLKLAEEAGMKATKTKIGHLNIAQLAGYLYSGILLGVFIPKFNIYMTKRLNKDNAQVTPEKVEDKKSEVPVNNVIEMASSVPVETNLLKKLVH